MHVPTKQRGITSKIPLLNLTGRQNIAIFKGVLGYALSLTLVFLRHFDKLNKVPTALTAVSLVAIAGQPGSTVGACVNQALLGLVGWGCGALGFVVLAELGLSTVAQGFVFFVFVYLAALVKAQSMKYFTASLLAILLAFNGLYTSVLLRGKFSKVYFYAFIEAYLWGFAIVIGINFFVFPTTAERQLRLLLLSSIDNISTFTHLIAKTYTLELTPAERALRDSLHLTIRTDMLFLTQKMVDVRMEVNLTRFSYSDYAKSIEHVRQLQQGLLSAYSSLVAIERTTDAGTLEEMRKEVAETGTREQFWKLRKAINIVISDLITAFDPDHSSPAHTDSISTDLGAPTRDDFQPSSSSKSIKDEELGDDTSALPILESAEQMEKTRKKLRDELGSPVRQGNGSAVVSQEWEAFKTQQRAATLAMLAGGDATDNELLLNAPGPSMGDE
ncbi:hypothetical protein MNV49_006504 [Pseudohyphozyma bogoriensis]|nr:hypothetical protein MNV49_006504 [Pseudohyphozyma bogoriensis]